MVRCIEFAIQKELMVKEVVILVEELTFVNGPSLCLVIFCL